MHKMEMKWRGPEGRGCHEVKIGVLNNLLRVLCYAIELPFQYSRIYKVVEDRPQSLSHTVSHCLLLNPETINGVHSSHTQCAPVDFLSSIWC